MEINGTANGINSIAAPLYILTIVQERGTLTILLSNILSIDLKIA